MYPILLDVFGANGGLKRDMKNMGIGTLNECTYCVSKIVRNGEMTVNFRYPSNGRHADQIKPFRIILCKTQDSQKTTNEYQPFIIYSIESNIDGMLDCNAYHVSYMYKYSVVRGHVDGLNDDMAFSNLYAIMLETTNNNVKYNYFRSISAGAKGYYKRDIPRSSRDIMGGTRGSILDRVGNGDWDFDRDSAKLHHMGADNGLEIRYGTNMLGMQITTDYSGIMTKCYPYWSKEEGSMKQYMSVETGVSSGHENDYPYVFEGVLDLSDEWDSKPTTEQLVEKAKIYMSDNRTWEPRVSVDVEFISINNKEGFSDVALGDSVRVIHDPMGIDVTARVVELSYDCINERPKDIVLGNKRMTMADAIREVM